ncbi:cyclic AMP-dependent transcription factor ATF-2 [Phymastichus coffea]|uniref:cyclic AMP-dependent transcription factor ATF-2 n=1 Tax=Phymastichus coffea TaxID=108790 RepID=UPI00273BC808|nr:cyclic AMP-dependent transcription factor ATF-2 [Phymastichus coffea]
MNHSEKPFACTTEGCNMSFVNEDHLTVHKKKHDMMLNLGINNKTNFFIADQTPTPTRFIRNCEEVGLFQDLQNDNPFEETFRRAVETGKSGVLTIPDVDNDDTLHTPSIFSSITTECNASIANTTTSIHIVKPDIKHQTELSLITTPIIKETNVETKVQYVEKNDESSIDTVLKKTQTVQPTSEILLSDNSNLVKPDALPIDDAEMQLLLKIQDGKVLRFIAAPAAELQEETMKPQMNELIESKITVKSNSNKSKTNPDQKLCAAKIKLKQVLPKNGTVIEDRATQNNKNENKLVEHVKEKRYNHIDLYRKQAILERNRASSMRARAKRKAWIEQLQDSLKTANQTNANLQAQVKSLHNQVAKLKTLLLAHKDCPVTKAMEGGNGIIVGSKILTINPDEMKQIPVMSRVVQSIKRLNTEKLIVPKKKPLILSCVKTPIILPKSNSTANTITLHGPDCIKTIPTISIVSPLVTQTSTTKQILSFMPTDVTEVSLAQDSPIIEHEDLKKDIISENTIT